MYQIHEQHRADIEEQRHHLARLMEENERARAKAEEEIELARESLAKEKEACTFSCFFMSHDINGNTRAHPVHPVCGG